MEDPFKLNKDLKLKYQNNETFSHKMDQKKKDYQQSKSVLANIPNPNICEQILEIFALEDDYEIYFYYAYLQPVDEKMNLAMYFLKNFKPRFDKKYKFIFFNNRVDTNKIFSEFKNIFLTLPLDFFLSLDQFIFVKPNFSLKVSQWLKTDELQKFFISKTIYVNDIKELCPILKTKIDKLIEFFPRDFALAQFPQQAATLELSGKKKVSDYRINLKGQERSFKEQKSFQNFVFSINNLFQANGNQLMQIDEYELNEAKLPYILQELFHYFEERPQKIQEEGLFRKSVSIDEENETLEELMRYNFEYLKKITNPHLIANLIKRFFAKLKTPIFPYNVFDKLMHDQGISDKLQHVKCLISDLPSKNYFPLMFLFEFLYEKILPYEKWTKMTANNLAICFAPCLLKSEKPSELDLIYATKSSLVVKLILDNFELIFGNKQHRQQQIRQTIQKQRVQWEEDLKKQIRSHSSVSNISEEFV